MLRIYLAKTKKNVLLFTTLISIAFSFNARSDSSIYSQALTDFESTLNNQGTVSYQQKKYYNKKETSSDKSFGGLIIAPPIEILATKKSLLTLQGINGYLISDAEHNLVYNDLTRDISGRLASVSMTFNASSHMMIAVDTGDLDGVVDVLVERDPYGGLTLTSETEEQELASCIESAVEALSTSKLLECLGMSSGDDTELEDWVSGMLAGPDCKGKGSLVTVPPQPGIDHFIAWNSGEAYAYGSGMLIRAALVTAFVDGELGDLYTDLANAALALGDAYEAYDTTEAGTPERAQAESDLAKARNDFRKASDAVQEWQEDSGSGSGNSSQPIPGEAGEVEDPRCQGIITDSERGTLFTNPHFCNDLDFITCLRNENDSLSAFTEGRCRREVGPDDQEHIVCDENDGDGFNPPDGSGGTPLPGNPDIGDPNAPLDSNKIDTRFIDVTPLGSILIGLCAQGGCPDNP